MPEENVGGIAVEFVANAEQLKSELGQLEQRLRQFDRAHGRQQVELTANIQAPSGRDMLAVRRDISRQFEQTGKVQTKIQLVAPSARDLGAINRAVSGGVKDVRIKVIGNFQWGEPPPKSITVPVVGGGGAGGVGGAASTADSRRGRTITNAPARPVAAQPQAAANPPPAAGRRPAAVQSAPARRAPAKTAANPLFRDYSIKDLVDEYEDETNRATYRQNVGRELQRRGIPLPAAAPAQPRVARSLVGGATGIFTAAPPVRAPHYGSTGVRVPGAAQVGALGRAGAIDLPASDIYNPYARGHAGTYATASKIQKSGLTEDAMAANLRRVLDRATPESTAAGTGWYRRAGQLTQSIAAGSGVGRTQAAAATAVFSSQAAWEKNVRNAQNFFDALRAGARTLEDVTPFMERAGRDVPTRSNIQKALDVAFAPGAQAIEQRLAFSRKGSKGLDNPKIREFWHGLMGDPNAAVIDRHQAMMMSGGMFENPSDSRAAAPFQRALRRVAGERGMSPADTQAVSWATILGHQIAGADPYGQMGARGYTGEASSLTWAERMQRARPRPLQLNSRGPFAQGVEARAPVDVDPRRLAPFREIDREKSPRLQQRGFDPTAFGRDYLDRLTEDIKQNGLREPITLEHDEVGQAQVTDGNHRLAAALRLGLPKVPVAVKPARGLLTGNTGPASGINDIIGARGFVNSEETHRAARLRDQRQSLHVANQARVAAQNAAAAQRRTDAERASKPLEGDAVEERNRRMAEILGLPYPAENPVPTVARGFAGPQGRFGPLTGTNYEPEHARLYEETGALRPEAAAYGARPRALEDAARSRAESVRARMQAQLQEPYGGFTYDPARERFLQPQPGRARGPFISSVGETERITPAQARDPEQFRAAIQRLTTNPRNAALLAAGGQIGGFHSPGNAQGLGASVDLDISRVDETLRAARATQRARGSEARGAYDVATGQGVFASKSGQMHFAVRDAIREAFEESTTPVGRRGDPIRFPYEPRVRSAPRQIQQHPREFLQAAQTTATPTDPTNMAVGEQRLRAALGEFGPQAAEDASQYLWQPPSRRKRAAVGVRTTADRSPLAHTSAALDPEAQERLRATALNFDPEAAARIDERLGQAQQATRVGSLGTFLSRQLAGRAGGVEAQQAIAIATKAKNEHLRVQEKLNDALVKQIKLEDSFKDSTGSARVEIEGQLHAQREVVGQLVDQEEITRRRRFATAERATELTGGPLRGLVSGFAGQLAGGLAIGAGFAAANAGIEAFTGLMGQAIEKMSGFTGTSNKVVNAIADQTRAQNGLVDVATTQAFVQAGLGHSTSQSIRPLLEERAALTAGNQAFGDQVGLIRTAVTLRRQNAEAAAGRAYSFGVTPGAIPGVTGSTGGFLGTPLGGQTPMVEQLAGMTPGSTRGEQTATQLGGAGLGLLGGAAVGAAAGAAFFGVGAIPGAIIGGIGGGLAGAGIGGAAAGGLAGLSDASIRPGQFNAQGELVGANAPAAAVTGGTAYRGARGATTAIPAMSAQEQDRYQAFSLAVLDMTEAAERAAPGISDMAHATQQSNDAQIAGTSRVLRQLGVAEDQISSLAKSRFAIVNGQGGVADRGQAEQFLRAAGKGAAIPAPEEFFRDLIQKTIPARQFQAAATGELQRRQNQMGFAVQQTANPLLAPGSTVPGGLEALSGSSIDIGGVNGANIASNIVRDRAAYQQDVAAGRKQILDFVGTLGATARQAASTDLSRLSSLGQRSAGLQQFIAGAQTGVQTAQYNEQIFQQQRALTDVNQILGRQGATQGDNLGLLEKQMIAYQRQGAMIQLNSARLGQQSAELGHQNDLLGLQAQKLQLGQSQRQINFQQSMAGFVTPGATPNEIAARQQEAKLEADYAQKQLDIRKEQFDLQKQQVAIGAKQLEQNAQLIDIQSKQVPLGFNIEDIGYQRQARDLGAGIDLAKMARDTNIAVAGAQEELAGVQAQIGEVTADLQTYMQEAATLAAGAISDEASAIATLGKQAAGLFGTVATAYSDAFNKYIGSVMASVNSAIRQLSGARGDGVTGSGLTGARQGGRTQFASGGLMDVSSATGMIVGEAGPETVAILRNPKRMPSLGGSGGLASGGASNISITINASGDMDEEKLAALVARKVEEIQSRRISLLGLRGV